MGNSRFLYNCWVSQKTRNILLTTEQKAFVKLSHFYLYVQIRYKLTELDQFQIW